MENADEGSEVNEWIMKEGLIDDGFDGVLSAGERKRRDFSCRKQSK